MSLGEWIEGLLRDVRALVGEPRTPPRARPLPLPLRPEEPFSNGWREGHPEEALALELHDALDGLGDPAASGDAARRIAAAMRVVAPGDLARFDETYRRAVWSRGVATEPRWLKDGSEADAYHLPQSREPVEALRVPDDSAPWVFGVLAMHPSGYVREGAVRRLAALRARDGDELPFLLLRANDWIPAVRAAAARAVEERAADAKYTPELVWSLPLLTRLAESTRGEVDAVVSAVRATLEQPAARSALLGGLHSRDRRVRRSAYALLMAGAEGAELRQLVVVGLHSEDQVRRSLAVRAVARMDLDSMRAVLPELMSAGNPPARTAGVQIAAKVGPEGEGWILAAVSDRNSMVRATARFVLKGRGADFAALNRRALEAGGADAEGALLGLGDLGRAEDAEVVEPFLAAARPHVRAAAVKTLDRLLRDAAVPAILPLLADESPRVSRAAAKALETRPVPPAALAAIFTGAHPPHARANALRLLARGSRWEVVPWMVRGAADGDPRVAGAARKALESLRATLYRSFQAPAPDQLARLSTELDAAGERIDPATAKWLREVVHSYGG